MKKYSTQLLGNLSGDEHMKVLITLEKGVRRTLSWLMEAHRPNER